MIIENASNKNWYLITADNIVDHYIHKTFLSHALSDLMSENIKNIVYDPIEYMFFSVTNQNSYDTDEPPPTENIVIDGLSIDLPSYDVPVIKESIDSMEIVMFVSGPQFYRIANEYEGLILSPNQKIKISEELGIISRSAANKFEEYLERINDVNP